MPAPELNRTALLDRMERQAQAINGPGMGTSIRYRELRGLLDIINDLQSELAQGRRADAREARRDATSASGTSDLGCLALEDLTVDGLRKIADRRGVDLGTAKAKGALISLVQAAAPSSVSVVASEATVDLTGELIRVFVDIFEQHPELWGSSFADAIDAWAAQTSQVLSVDWREKIAAAVADA